MLRPTDALPTYLRDFRESRHNHDLIAVFRAVRDLIGVQRVVYPGSYVHPTPSLVFPSVCYVDSVKGFGAAMQSEDLAPWLDAHKEYPEPVELTAIETAYNRIPSTLHAGFGLMISLNAGAISQECKPLLSPGAHPLRHSCPTSSAIPAPPPSSFLRRQESRGAFRVGQPHHQPPPHPRLPHTHRRPDSRPTPPCHHPLPPTPRPPLPSPHATRTQPP